MENTDKVKMSDAQISLNILKIISDLKTKPSDFINIFKIKANLTEAVNYFTAKEQNNLRLFGDSHCTKGSPDRSTLCLGALASNNSFMINISQKEYPELLKEIYFPPPLLFCKGLKNISENNLKIAVVGTRRCSDYGHEAAAYISKELSKIGFTIISGMALGIDKTAHFAAIKETGGSIGVLGTGIDIEYPYENKKLYSEIIENGGLVTEFLPGTPPLKSNFPARNRIISGMSIGVIVIEAGEKSGAVVTAKSAIRENREVFAVPGSIFSDKSKGCHNLIKSGAKLVENIDDILDEFSNYIKDSKYNNPIRQKQFECSKNFVNGKILNTASDKKHKNNQNYSDSITPGYLPDNDYVKVYECIGFKEKSLEEIIVQTCL
ncbi:MAG: DNA-processing protein DprA, partial [Actinomycetota bacterium]